MKRPGALGRGLDALFSAQSSSDSLRSIPLDLLQPGRFQPRRHFPEEALEELASSIRSEGVLQPILVRALAEGRFEILAGERRWRAAQRAGLREIPALVRECGDQQALAIGLIENIQRQDLNPLEEAQALQRLVDEFHLTHDALAQSLGRSRAAISNQLRLLRLDPSLATHLQSGALSAGHARALAALEPTQQRELAMRAVREGLSVRQMEKLAGQSRKKRRAPSADANVQALTELIAAQLGLPVQVRQRGQGGELRIRWRDAAEEAELWQRLQLDLSALD
ncbi:ParB/RepB/Spo0J family partition protein [Acidithiobacillus sp.]|uniref:ParB/RepB/Spo0J family partition protein n=1 Tax=Acidithiobacillus sp. TaxID=1872118 RepID=UPI0025C402E5|nr:ParB/RepB/Spo0J family partition protein [Acidithiobacillus sp.]